MRVVKWRRDRDRALATSGRRAPLARTPASSTDTGLEHGVPIRVLIECSLSSGSVGRLDIDWGDGVEPARPATSFDHERAGGRDTCGISLVEVLAGGHCLSFGEPESSRRFASQTPAAIAALRIAGHRSLLRKRFGVGKWYVANGQRMSYE